MLERTDRLKISNQRILLTPLNWGLGHATRSAALIDQLLIDNEILIASDGQALEWLANRYPNIRKFTLPNYPIAYSSSQMWWNMLRSARGFYKCISAERSLIQQLIKDHKIDLVISDHRLGCYSELCKSVVIAHQLHIPHTNILLSKIATFINRAYLNQYDEIWIPDFQNQLSGRLSQSKKSDSIFEIGPLSLLEKDCHQEKNIDLLILLSGPEPSRTELETLICHEISTLQLQSKVLIRGTNKTRHLPKALYDQFNKVFDLANSETVNMMLNRSFHIVCRSGYSTLMDLNAVRRHAILIPTPGQPEQEYLGKFHSKKGHLLIFQNELINSLPIVIDQARSVRGKI